MNPFLFMPVPRPPRSLARNSVVSAGFALFVLMGALGCTARASSATAAQLGLVVP